MSNNLPLRRASRRLRVLSWIGLSMALAAGSLRWFFASKDWMPPAVVAWMPPGAASAYRSLGKGVLGLGIANALYTTLIIAVFTFSFEKHSVVIGFGLSHADLYLLIIGGAVMMLGHVMDEAGRLHRENSEFV